MSLSRRLAGDLFPRHWYWELANQTGSSPALPEGTDSESLTLPTATDHLPPSHRRVMAPPRTDFKITRTEKLGPSYIIDMADRYPDAKCSTGVLWLYGATPRDAKCIPRKLSELPPNRPATRSRGRDECSVCLMEVYDGGVTDSKDGTVAPVCQLSCGHTFHVHCITEWFKRGDRRHDCPNCRSFVFDFDYSESDAYSDEEEQEARCNRHRKTGRTRCHPHGRNRHQTTCRTTLSH